MGKRQSGLERRDMARFPPWLVSCMDADGIALWGVADLCDFSTPTDATGGGFPIAVSWAVPMDPATMAGIRNGPTEPYGALYIATNLRINALAEEVAGELRRRGSRALPLAASVRTDEANLRGDFPHKTAATRAGLGWIGRHCQLVTFEYGPWVRLGTVFTDMDLPTGPTIEQDFCGKCDKCVEACPADALSGEKWHPGLVREAILDARACDDWKTEQYPPYNGKHNCGICSSACPFGLKVLRRLRRG
jgi:epoxyqueuosine reductase